jgi:hypothetical protein
MGYAYTVVKGIVVNRKQQTVETFNYEAFNAHQNLVTAQEDRAKEIIYTREALRLETKRVTIAESEKEILELRSEYSIKKTSRVRQMEIIERILDLEDYLIAIM